MADIGNILRSFDQIVDQDQTVFINQDESASLQLLQCTKELFHFIKENEVDKKRLSPLDELVIDDLSHEQIWQQLQLQNLPLLKILTHNLKRLSADQDWKLTSASHDQNQDTDSQDSLDSNDSSQDNDIDDDDDDDINVSNKSKKVHFDLDHSSAKINRNVDTLKKNSIVDDKFFKLAEMNQFLQMEEQKMHNQTMGKPHDDDQNDDNDEIEMFADIESEDDDWKEAMQKTANLVGKSKVINDSRGQDMKYNDFFDPPSDEEPPQNTGKNIKATLQSQLDDENDFEDDVDFSLKADLSDNDNDPDGASCCRCCCKDNDKDQQDQQDKQEEKLSMHEKRQNQLKSVISEYEEVSLAEKPWQLFGEVGARQRPPNSLLQEDLMFDFAANKTPVITEEKSQSLEDVIIQRIKEEAWDDVERKVKPVELPFEYRSRIELDHEKSKLSLSEIYEKEYLQQREGTKIQDKPEVTEAKELMKSLFAKLDALSNFHFTPKPLKKEIEVVANVPAINMEEVAPISTSDATLLAPEEIKAKARAEFKGESEKTSTDKLRERKLRKKSKKLRFKERIKQKKLLASMKPGLGNKYSKKEAVQRLQKDEGLNGVSFVDDRGSKNKKTALSSSAFFDKLQQEAKRDVEGKTIKKTKVKKKLSASAFKL